MNILYTVNDKFVPQIGAGICSICENNLKETEINFFVFSLHVSKKNKIELEKLVKKYRRSIYIVELDDINQYFDFQFDTLGWNPIILARLLMGKILPEWVKRVLYLDGDTIVRGSLDKLWRLDLDNKILGMCIEPTADKKRREKLGLENRYYYNSGVLLVDLEKWREKDAGTLIIRFYQKWRGRLFAADQDAINGALKDEIYPLLPKYNFCNIYYQYPYKFLCTLVKPLRYISFKAFQESVKNPIIIHYLGEERPWRSGNTHKYRKDYQKYLAKTYWRDTPYEKGWRLYFICWEIFNKLTRPFPKVRYSIINYLIPYFMKFRSIKLRREKGTH